MNNGTLEKFNLMGGLCVITGGAGFLGPKHAEALLDGGGRVVLMDINEERLVTVSSELGEIYKDKNRIMSCVCDITREEEVKSATESIIRDFGRIKVLINNAAVNTPVTNEDNSLLTRFENFPLETWLKEIEVGLTGAFLMSKYIGQHMAKNGGGIILNIASDLGVIAPDQRIYQKPGLLPEEQPVKSVAYSVVKHGLIGLTKYLATYWPDKNVRVNSISPGGVYDYRPSDEFVAKLTGLIPLGRMANADEYKAAILFLCSDASSYMTGANLIIDGGRTCW